MANDIIKIENDVVALGDVIASFEDEMDGLGSIPLPKVSTPAGGGLAFTIGDDDDAEVTKEIQGVIVAHNSANVFYERSIEDSDGNTYPDCSSPDGKAGYDRRTGEIVSCKECKLNQYDDATGRKPCSNRHNVYILRNGDILPLQLSLPATSLANFKKLIASQVVLKGRRTTQMVVKATLEKAESKGGQSFSRYKWAVVGMLGEDDAAAMAAYAADFKAFIAERDRDFAMSQPVIKEMGEAVEADSAPDVSFTTPEKKSSKLKFDEVYDDGSLPF